MICSRAGLPPDTAYGSAEMLDWLVNKQQIAPHIPVIDKSGRDDGSRSPRRSVAQRPSLPTQPRNRLDRPGRSGEAWTFDGTALGVLGRTDPVTANPGGASLFLTSGDFISFGVNTADYFHRGFELISFDVAELAHDRAANATEVARRLRSDHDHAL